ncbi:hypothetical protein C479_06157 [Halovivax asiaticus JCM 14624]|uniref:Uncharacterized protein n=1 Tax=Halovivax asiaticus JCM 14624 TaxID=1227490 RepID=M0BMB0_9EURY|nr:hypothetical protein [Halovivax asiaticus]ELZ12006.1 hypothetical protein C479_06157 [Halovivax asiaticus JCM 14624]
MSDVSIDRVDPARTGVKAGRVVGLLTAILAVVSLLSVREAFVGRLLTSVELVGLGPSLVGLDPGATVTVYFWLYTAGAVVGRYALAYVIGSLVGVVYDWLENPSIAALVAIVLAIGLVDGAVQAFDTRSLVLGGAYVLAWLAYVPAFYWLHDPDADTRPERHRRGG